MKVSDIGLMALICREGIALGWYYDSVGVATLGIGHTAMAGPPNPKVKGTVTIREAFDLFHHDIEKYADTVRNTIKRPMLQHEFDAFVSICYNIGQGGFAGSTFAKKFNAGDKAGCAKAIMYWKKPAEIIGRRTSERDQFKGKVPIKFIATVYAPGSNGRLGKASSMDLVRELQVNRPSEPVNTPVSPTVKDAILKTGSKGPFVRELQTSLVALGYPLKIDGDFGTGTETAVRAFQRANGLNVDGWAGPRTIDAVGRALGEKKAAPKIEKAAEQTKDKAEREVQKKTGLWQWITGLFSSGALGLGWLAGMDWQAVAAIGGVVIVFLIVILVMRRQIIGAVKDIKSAVEGGA